MSTPREAACALALRLKQAGHTAVLAGGCVRDAILGKHPKDFDVATSATPTQVLEIFPKANQVGAHFGVIIVKMLGIPIEVATFRTDGSYLDGRRPENVQFSTPELDAQRRDFTVNGLFQDPETDEIIDYVGGCSDLAARVLRAIGDPQQRFSEDALRLMRAVRFAATLDFAIEENTWNGIRQLASTLSRISVERIRDELSRMLAHPSRAKAFSLLADSGLWHAFWPEVMTLIGCEQPPEWHPEGDVFTHTRIMLTMLPPDAPLELALSVVLHDIAKPPTRTIDADTGRIRFNGHDELGAVMAEDMLRRLKFSNDIIHAVIPMVARHMQFMNVQKMRIAKLKRFMSTPTFPLEMELHRVDCASSNGFTDNYEFLTAKATDFANEPLIPPPLLTGRDLIKAGLTPSSLFSEILEEIQTLQLESTLTTREQALAYFQNKWLSAQ